MAESSSRWFKKHPLYSVYEAELDPEARNYVFSEEPVCGRLSRSKASWLYSFPETRPAILEAWKYMQEHNTFKAPYRINKQLGPLVAKARQERGREQMPTPLFLRSEFGPLGGIDE